LDGVEGTEKKKKHDAHHATSTIQVSVSTLQQPQLTCLTTGLTTPAHLTDHPFFKVKGFLCRI